MNHSSPRRPRVFISSTIYDFRDLRSALKFWLEERGYEVLLSELNDFAKSVDINSYDACLSTISNCDYFILLIGSRVGGLYDKSSRTSITRKEYQRAYECLTEGRLKILTFVRQDVWTVYEDRRALEEYLEEVHLKSNELTQEQIRDITRHRTRIVTDAQDLFSFIDEVKRAAEMKEAMKTGTGFPKGNWIHQFTTFGDIVDSLRQTLGVSGNLRRNELEANLSYEIFSNLRGFLGRDKKTGKLILAKWADDPLRRHVEACITPHPAGHSEFDSRTFNSFAFLFPSMGGKPEKFFLEEALNSGEFLDYDTAGNRFVIGPLQQLLIDLRAAVDSCVLAHESVASRSLAQHCTTDPNAKVRISNVELMVPLAFLDSHDHLAEMLVHTLNVLQGKTPPQPAPKRSDRSLLAIKLPLHAPITIADVEAWLQSQ